MSQVWEHSQAKGGALVVLLAIADFADDSGKAWPSVETLAKKARMKERNVQLSIRKLRKLGELRVSKPGKFRSNTYHVAQMGAIFTPPQSLRVHPTTPQDVVDYTPRVHPTTPEPSLTVSEPPIKVSRKKRAPNPLTNSPEIEMYREITKRRPLEENYQTVIESLRGKTLEVARPYFAAWMTISENRGNLTWLVDWLQSGRPACEFGAKRNGHNTNHQPPLRRMMSPADIAAQEASRK